MKVISLKTDGRVNSLHLPCGDEILTVSEEDDEPIMAEELASDAGAIIIHVPVYYDLDALLIQLNTIAKRSEHQPK